jgi:hypothetical protein
VDPNRYLPGVPYNRQQGQLVHIPADPRCAWLSTRPFLDPDSSYLRVFSHQQQEQFSISSFVLQLRSLITGVFSLLLLLLFFPLPLGGLHHSFCAGASWGPRQLVILRTRSRKANQISARVIGHEESAAAVMARPQSPQSNLRQRNVPTKKTAEPAGFAPEVELDKLAKVAAQKGAIDREWDYKIVFAIITALAFVTRFWGISHPNEVVFDEVHFGKVCDL